MHDLSPRAQELLAMTRRADGPDPARRRKVRAGLAAALVAIGGSGAAKASLLAGSGVAHSLAPGLVGKGMSGLWVKVLGVGMAGWFAAGSTAGVLVAVSGHYLSAEPQQAAMTRGQPAPARPPGPIPTERSATQPLDTPRPELIASARAEPSKHGSVEAATLARETALLDRTQLALRSGDTAGALELLDQYDRRFAEGLLREEASAARVLALCRAERSEEGKQAASAFARRFPASPLLPRVRRACGRSAESRGAH